MYCDLSLETLFSLCEICSVVLFGQNVCHIYNQILAKCLVKKVKHNEKVCHVQDLGFYNQTQRLQLGVSGTCL